MHEIGKIDLSKLLGFQVMGDESLEKVDFQD